MVLVVMLVVVMRMMVVMMMIAVSLWSMYSITGPMPWAIHTLIYTYDSNCK